MQRCTVLITLQLLQLACTRPAPTRLQRRALATYVRRLYYPYLLHEPELAAAEGELAAGALPFSEAGQAAVPLLRQLPSFPSSVPERSDLLTLPCRQPPLQCGPTTMRPWQPRPWRASAPAAPWWCAACTTCPLRWRAWSACASRRVSWGQGQPAAWSALRRLCGGLLGWFAVCCVLAQRHLPSCSATHAPMRCRPLSLPAAGLSGLSPGTLHVVLTGEGEAALVLSEAAHKILRQQNVEGYAPSGAPVAWGWRVLYFWCCQLGVAINGLEARGGWAGSMPLCC